MGDFAVGQPVRRTEDPRLMLGGGRRRCRHRTNPMPVKGQIAGGIAQGAGQILMEAIHYDPDSGQNLTGSFMGYAMPRATMLPNLEIYSLPASSAVRRVTRAM